MTEFFVDYGLFLAKSLTFLLVVALIIAMIAALSKKTREPEKLEVRDLNRKYDEMRSLLHASILPAKARKKQARQDKAKRKATGGRNAADTPRLFVLNFHGDLKASAVSSMREEITAILTLAQAGDAVLLRLENMGGVVHEHGLAASQLKRLRSAGVHVTVAVDKVAASGGYMMACVADRIIAAPFAVLGSIGVLAQLPNFHELLKRHGIDFEQQTAGEYKRTITMFGANTEKERAKLREQIEQTHELFKTFIAEHRPALDLDTVATGEIWYGSDAVAVGLVDDIQTSDDFLLAASHSTRLFEVKYRGRKSIGDKLRSRMDSALEHAVDAIRQRLAPPSI